MERRKSRDEADARACLAAAKQSEVTLTRRPGSSGCAVRDCARTVASASRRSPPSSTVLRLDGRVQPSLLPSDPHAAAIRYYKNHRAAARPGGIRDWANM
jgi:hypothetical protein